MSNFKTNRSKREHAAYEKGLQRDLWKHFKLAGSLEKKNRNRIIKNLINEENLKNFKILEFGAVVEYLEAPGNEVLLHISEMAWQRTNAVTDVVNVGDEFEVKYLGFDPRTKKDKVSLKALLEKPEGYVERPPRKAGGGNRDRRGGRDNRNRR